MSAIEVSYLWSEQEYLTAAHQHSRFGAANSREKIIVFVVGALIFASVFMMLQRGFQPTDSMAFILALYWFVFRARLHKRLLRKRFLSSEQKDKQISLDITDELITARTEGLSEGDFKWDSVTKVVRTNDGFLLYRGVAYIWLPNTAFQAAEMVERFAALSERKADLFIDKSKR